MKAYELLEKPEAWTQGAAARDKEGRPISPDSLFAVCRCVESVIWKLYPENYEEILERLAKFLGLLSWVCIPRWNDAPERTHAEIIAALKAVDI